jgi:CHAT domain-containing protein
MAVMAGLYKKKESQLNPLPGAVQEAAEILQAYNALEMPATLGAFTELLDRELKRNFQPVGGADAFHFAGHGYFDPAWSDGAVLYLSNGDTLPPILFEGAKYGGEQQPFFFLNACMLGIGGEVLNDIAGFPGHCLRGGFGALLGALWVVDDSVARDVAIEFWRRALAPGGAEEPVAAVLRDIRSKYDSKAPQTTYLAYVFYGHPRLSLKRSAVPATAVVDQAAQVATPHL